jgi:hypothetical protein
LVEDDDPKLVFEMECKYGARRVYKFNVEEAVLNCAVFDKVNVGMHVTIKPKSLVDALNNFTPNQEEVRWMMEPAQVQIQSHFNEVRLAASEIKNRAPVSITLDSNDFERYEIGAARKVEYVLSLHDMRPALMFAEKAGTPIAYSTVYDIKKPIVMSVVMSNFFTGDFVFASCGDVKIDDGTGSVEASASVNGVTPSQNYGASSSITRTNQAQISSQSSSHHGTPNVAPQYQQQHQPSSPSSYHSHGAVSSGGGGGSSGWAQPADEMRYGNSGGAAALPPRTLHGTPHTSRFQMPPVPSQPAGQYDELMAPAAKRRKIDDDLEEGDVGASQSEESQ